MSRLFLALFTMLSLALPAQATMAVVSGHVPVGSTSIPPSVAFSKAVKVE